MEGDLVASLVCFTRGSLRMKIQLKWDILFLLVEIVSAPYYNIESITDETMVKGLSQSLSLKATSDPLLVQTVPTPHHCVHRVVASIFADSGLAVHPSMPMGQPEFRCSCLTLCASKGQRP